MYNADWEWIKICKKLGSKNMEWKELKVIEDIFKLPWKIIQGGTYQRNQYKNSS